MKKTPNYVITIMGIVLLGAGICLLNNLENPNQFMTTLPYVLIGLGCGIFGHGMGNLIAGRAVKNSADIQKQMDIEKNDERNITISNRAKAKAYDYMCFAFGALMISFTLMGVAVMPVLLLVFTYLLVQVCAIYYRFKYDKEM